MHSQAIADRMLRKYTRKEANEAITARLGTTEYTLQYILKTGGVETHGADLVARVMARVWLWKSVARHIQEA